MSIESRTVTFDVEEILALTLSLFVDTLGESRSELAPPYSQSSLFEFYEDFISYPIDGLKDKGDVCRIDFYEAVLVMSWAIYREWVRKVVVENCQLDCFSDIPTSHVIELFLDNLSCEEGMALLEKVRKESSDKWKQWESKRPG